MTFILAQRQQQQHRHRVKQLLPSARSEDGLGHIKTQPGREKGQERQIHWVCCLQGYSIAAGGPSSNLGNSGGDGDGVPGSRVLPAPAGPAAHPQDGKGLWKQRVTLVSVGHPGVRGTLLEQPGAAACAGCFSELGMVLQDGDCIHLNCAPCEPPAVKADRNRNSAALRNFASLFFIIFIFCLFCLQKISY